MGILDLVLVVVVVLLIIGLCWYLIGTIPLDQRIKNTINVVIVIGLLIWLVAWLLPRLTAFLR